MAVLETGFTMMHAMAESGISVGEAYIEEIEALEVEVNGGQVVSVEFLDSRGVGIRIFENGRLGFAYTSRFTENLVDELIREAVQNSCGVDPDPDFTLPRTGRTGEEEGPALDIYHPQQSLIPLEDKVDAAIRAERAALKYDPRITGVRSATYTERKHSTGIVNSQDFAAEYSAGTCSTTVSVVAEEGESVESGWAFNLARQLDDLPVEETGEEAADRAVSLLGARGMEPARLPVILNPVVAVTFLDLIAEALTADTAQKDKSLYKGRLGDTVASRKVSLIDDGTLEAGSLCAPFDDEGVRTQKTVLVEDGVLRTLLYDTYTAHRDGREFSTGNGMRSSFRDLPSPGHTNFYLQPRNELSRDQLITRLDKGLYVMKVMGMPTADPISGDFSVSVSGLTVDKGQFSMPVRGVTLAGNLSDLLHSIDAVGDDLKFFSSLGSPSISVREMALSG